MTVPLAYDAATLAAALCISPDTLDSRVKDGSIPPPRVLGGKRIWRPEEVQEALAALPVWGKDEKPEPTPGVKIGSWRESNCQKASPAAKTGKAGRSDITTADAGRKKASRAKP